MAFIKVESEDMTIEKAYTVKQEDTEKQTEMALIKEESEEVTTEEAFRVKHEDTEQQTEMMFIKEESEDMKIEETFRVKHEDTEQQTGWFHTQSLYLVILHHESLYLLHTTRDKMNDVTN